MTLPEELKGSAELLVLLRVTVPVSGPVVA